MSGNLWRAQSKKDCIAIIRAALDAGINLIDTAPQYGRGYAESTVGQAVRRRRDRVIISTKCGLRFDTGKFEFNLSPESIRWEIEESLRRLQTDYIDLYYCHWPDNRTPEEEVGATMMKLKAEGKIRAIGLSNFDTQQMDRFIQSSSLDSLQPPFSLLHRDAEKDLLPWCREHQVGVLSYGSIGGGMLSGKYTTENFPGDKRFRFYKHFQHDLYPKALEVVDVVKNIAKDRSATASQVAIAWVLAQPGITSALVGARGPDQVTTNVNAADLDLNKDEISALNRVSENLWSEEGA
jgi:aryl-alcohol dehydrogenase-like predicted oxidoreductase